MKDYSQEEVKSIIANVVQSITNDIYKIRNSEGDMAKESALRFVDGSDKEERYDSLKHIYVDRKLGILVADIKDCQYHMRIDEMRKGIKK